MSLLSNTSGERGVGKLNDCLEKGASLDAASPSFSRFPWLRERPDALGARRHFVSDLGSDPIVAQPIARGSRKGPLQPNDPQKTLDIGLSAS